MTIKIFRKLWWVVYPDEGTAGWVSAQRREDEWGRRGEGGTSRMHHLTPRLSLGQWLNSNSALFVSRVPKKGGSSHYIIDMFYYLW